MTTLFVYGTLKRGRRNHRYLAGAEFLGEARTRPRYRLHEVGPYPGLADDPADGLAVRGELWRVDAEALRRLDAFEGVPDLFERRPVELDGPAAAEAYFYARPVPAGAVSGAEWPFFA